MNVAAIIQARMGSTRLPGKVLIDLAGAPMLTRVIERALACPPVTDVVVATSDKPEDDDVARVARAAGAVVFRGSPSDVLARYHGAARLVAADVIVRLTADCPLLDPEVIAAVIAALDGAADYASNTHVRTFPRGLDAEAFHADTLARLHRIARSPAAREHVTAGVMEAPERFVIRQVVAPRDDSDLRLTVDTHSDLDLVRAVYHALDLAAAPRPYRDVVELLRRRPDLVDLNAGVAQRAWHDAEAARA